MSSITVGTHKGNVTRKTDAAIATRFLLGKVGSDEDHIALCGVGEKPIGIITDEATAAEKDVNVALLGGTDETRKGVASGAVAAGDNVYPAAAGKLSTLAAGGTHYLSGRAITGAADNETFEFIPVIGEVKAGT
jgi:hypothetical protein